MRAGIGRGGGALSTGDLAHRLRKGRRRRAAAVPQAAPCRDRGVSGVWGMGCRAAMRACIAAWGVASLSVSPHAGMGCRCHAAMRACLARVGARALASARVRAGPWQAAPSMVASAPR